MENRKSNQDQDEIEKEGSNGESEENLPISEEAVEDQIEAEKSAEDTLQVFKIKQLERRISEYEAKISEYQSKISEIRDYVKRMEGEISDIRARSEREIQRSLSAKLSSFFLLLLPIIDDFELCVKNAQEDLSPLADGVRLIHLQFENFLKEVGLQRIEAKGKVFDPALHEAIATMPTESDEQDGQVVQEVKTGYRFKEQVIRPAQVVVGAKRETH